MKYILRNPERAFLKALPHLPKPIVALLTGPPGTGKTYFSEWLAHSTESRFLYLLLHQWSTDEELVASANLYKLSTGKASCEEEAYNPGFLWNAANLSQSGKVVMCLDELDKASSRTEALMLRFLETGRVYSSNGCLLSEANLENLIVIITSNGARELLSPTIRRTYRMQFSHLPKAEEVSLLVDMGVRPGIAKILRDLADITRAASNGEHPSLPEMTRAAKALEGVKTPPEISCVLTSTMLRESDTDVRIVTQAANLIAADMGRSTAKCDQSITP